MTTMHTGAATTVAAAFLKKSKHGFALLTYPPCFVKRSAAYLGFDFTALQTNILHCHLHDNDG